MEKKKNKILIIGASRGIGFQLSKYLYKKHYEIIIVSKNKKRLEKAYNQIKEKRNIEKYVLDISNLKSTKKSFLNILKNNKNLSTIINCAGTTGSIEKFKDCKFENWQKVINTNFLGVTLIVQLFIRYLGSKKKGTMIQLSGGGATQALHSLSAYSASKTAVIRFMENISLEERKINFYSIAPGTIITNLSKKIHKSGPKKLGKIFFNKLNKKLTLGGDDIKKSFKLIKTLIDNNYKNLSGTLLSSIWDDRNYIFSNNLDYDMFKLRRVDGKRIKIK